MKPEFSRQIFRKYPNIKFGEHVQRKPICSTRTDKRTDMTKLMVAFRNPADQPNKEWSRNHILDKRRPSFECHNTAHSASDNSCLLSWTSSVHRSTIWESRRLPPVKLRHVKSACRRTCVYFSPMATGNQATLHLEVLMNATLLF